MKTQTNAERIRTLATLNWQRDESAGRHKICGEFCTWIAGNIDGVALSAWMSEASGMVYLHAGADYTFDAFLEICRNGWPVVKVAPVARGFDFGDDDG